MPSWVAWQSSEWMKVGLSVTASPQASSTGVAPAKDALAWHASQQSSQQPQSQPQLLQESQPVLRVVVPLLQAQPVRALPQELQPQVSQPQLLQPQLLQPHRLLLQGLQEPQGPV